MVEVVPSARSRSSDARRPRGRGSPRCGGAECGPRSSGSPSRFTWRLKARVQRSGWTGVPSAWVKTRSLESSQPSPSCSRSSAWRARVPAEGGNGRLVETDPALGLRRRLGRVEHELVVDRGEGQADADEAGVEVDVLPTQPHRLAASHPRGGDEHVGGMERVVLDAGEKLAELGSGPRLHLGLGALRRSSRRGRVADEHAQADAVVERLPQRRVGRL